MKRQNLLLLLAALAIAILPLFIIRPPAGDAAEIFTGADGQAETVITGLRPDYKPWFAPLWEPPSGEIESLLFGLQAAIGAGLIGYCLGFYRGRSNPQ
ncbi:energy-coupling factor ABC transporter substrate-binding protein [Termitidicoccus mucosus]|uniref:Cobalt transport protein CbiN n=1 Tax=Termitidicoccus mucosus TaxID=1184151 RepID=A0A178II86_9BACT|nr:hypothetical protein AW736_15440 [Opitutaceae bacterium TSB47]